MKIVELNDFVKIPTLTEKLNDLILHLQREKNEDYVKKNSHFQNRTKSN